MIPGIVCTTSLLIIYALYLAYMRGFRAGQEDVLSRVVPPLDKRADHAVSYEKTLDAIAGAGKSPSGDSGDPQTIARAALRAVRGHT